MGGSVPPSWCKRWEGPGKPAPWLALLARKASAIARWKQQAADGSLLDAELDLNDVFRPLTFLNALRQLTARKAACPMDALHLVSGWSKGAITAPAPIVVKGLLLQGAELQGTTLVEAATDAPEIVLMPSLAIGYAQADQASTSLSRNDGTLQVPLYHDATREQFLVEIALPLGREDPDIWVLAGIAIFLSDAL